MNVNGKIKKAMIFVMTGAVIAASIMYDVFAAEETGIEKEETIYVKTDAAGSAEEIIVSNWLRNLDHAAELQDTSSLTDIKNVKGDETFVQNGENLTWKADGKDIYYQGKTDKELPVTVTVSYYLDGKEIAPEDLSGKSGHVKICYQYENKMKQEEVYVPFMLVTGLILDHDSFRNVEVTNGKYINDGDRTIVIGFGLPGLKENLDFDVLDLDIPDGFEVDADVTEFSAKISMTVASPLDLSDMGLDTVDSWDDLKDKMDELKEGITQLVDGSGELADGVQTLKDGCEELVDGMTDLDDGAADLQNGAAELDEGMGSLNDGISTLNTKKTELINGAKQLADGLNILSSKKKELTDGVDSVDLNLKKLQGGSRQVTEGIVQVNAALPEKMDQLAAGLKQISDGIDQNLESADLKKGLEELTTRIGGYIDGVTQYINAIYHAEDGSGYLDEVNQIFAGMKQVDISLGHLIEQLENVPTQQPSAGVNAEAVTALEASIAGNQAVLESLLDVQAKKESIPDGLLKMYSGSYHTYSSQLDNCISELQRDISNSQAALETMRQTQTVTAAAGIERNGTGAGSAEQQSANQQTERILESLRELKAAVSRIVIASEQMQEGYDTALQTNGQTIVQGGAQIKEGMADACTAFTTTLATQLTTISDSIKQANNGVTMIRETLYGTEQEAGVMKGLENGSSQVTNGIETMEKAVSEQLVPGSKELADGVKQLADGGNTLNSGMEIFSNGIKDLKNGSEQLKGGMSELTGGTGVLKEGTERLKEGGKDLNDGAQKLLDGANELKEGVEQFSEEGIEKITDFVDQDLQDMMDRLKTLQDVSGTCRSFSRENGENLYSVKFIIETAGIES